MRYKAAFQNTSIDNKEQRLTVGRDQTRSHEFSCASPTRTCDIHILVDTVTESAARRVATRLLCVLIGT